MIAPDTLAVDPSLPVHEFVDTFGNRCARLTLPEGSTRLYANAIVKDSGLLDEVDWLAPQVGIANLPDDALQFLLSSRYCEVDEMIPIAWDLFGYTQPGWGRVQAICNWVNQHVAFDYAKARPTKTALNVYTERVGVCRDFTHLAVTFCRAMNIPARYCNGYLGDIGIAPVDLPMDFNAWFEVYLGGRWYTFDARHNEPRIGRVLIARGRDAADIPMITTYGSQTLERFVVHTEEMPEANIPLFKPLASVS
jgi:transglutaminase-like putative cysteine protease